MSIPTLRELEMNSTLREVERVLIIARFNQLGKNRTKTARSLGIGIRTLQRKLDQYGIPKGTQGKPVRQNDAGSSEVAV